MSQTNTEISLEDLLGYMDDETPVNVDPNNGIYNVDNTNEEEDDLLDSDDNQEPIEKDDTPVPSVEPDSTDKDTEPKSSYKEYFNILSDNGLLYVDEDFEFEDSAEGLEKAIAQTSKNMSVAAYTSLWEKLPDVWKPALKYALSGGENIDEYLSTFKSVDLEKLNIEDSVENQKTVLREYYKATSNYTPDKVNRIIDKLHLLGELESEAASTLVELKELEKEKRDKIAADQVRLQEEQEENAKKYRENINTAIDKSSAIPSNRKPKVKAFILNVSKVGDDVDTEFNRTLRHLSSNPEHLGQLADFLYDSYNPQKGFNFERFRKQEGSQAVNTLKKQLEDLNNSKRNMSGAASKINNDNFDWEQYLKLSD